MRTLEFITKHTLDSLLYRAHLLGVSSGVLLLSLRRIVLVMRPLRSRLTRRTITNSTTTSTIRTIHQHAAPLIHCVGARDHHPREKPNATRFVGVCRVITLPSETRTSR